MKKIKARLKELFPKRIDQAEFFGVDYYDLTRKINTIENKLNWLKTNLEPLGLTIKIVEDAKESE